LELTEGLPIDVDKIRQGEQAKMLPDLIRSVEQIHTSGKHPVIYTSRKELSFHTQEQRLHFGEQVSDLLMHIVRRLPPTIGFLISKGGITSNDVLSKGLELRTSRVLGQILPGCSIVQCPFDHSRFPNMPVVIFPGNVGNDLGLVEAFQRLAENK
jgi:uncharacterized protein YgbK (DUF1537 family)